MKILFLSHLFPLPLDSGGKIKSFYTLRTLAKEHDVRVLTYVRNEQEHSLIGDLQKMCPNIDVVWLNRGKLRQVSDLLSSLGTRRSFIVSRDYREQMQAAFRDSINSFAPDVVHIDHLQMAQFVDFRGPYKTVLDNHNVEHMIIRRIADTDGSPAARLYTRIEWPKLRRYELEVCRSCDMVLTVSEEDKNTLQDMDAAINNIRCVPIGVDIDYFNPVERNADSRNLLSVGTMYWPPNVDSMLYFSREIFPIIKKQVPGCTLTIAGQRPVAAIQSLSADPSISVTGYVDDVRETARDCGAFVVPLRSGSGVRVKILNAMAMGLPIVSTSIGVEGIAVKDGVHALIADSPRDFSEASIKVLQDRDLAQQLGDNGRKLVCEKYSWDAVGKQLLDIYQQI